jgi:hypothetical protein
LLKIRVVAMQFNHGDPGMSERSCTGKLFRPMENLGRYASILQGALCETVEVRGENDTHSPADDQLRDGSVGATWQLQVSIPVIVGRLKEACKKCLACSRSRGKRTKQGGVT